MQHSNHARHDPAIEPIQADIHELVEVFTASIDARHAYTRGHSERVAYLSAEIARSMGLDESLIQLAHVAGHLHDVGKIGVADHILLKPGKLLASEYEAVKSHPVIGYEILRKVRSLETIARIVKHHHERWDGRGYPDRLRGDEIPLIARIIAVADSYDAMTSARAYRLMMNHEAAVDEVYRCQGTQFDPEVVQGFLQMSGPVYANIPAYSMQGDHAFCYNAIASVK